MDKVRNTEVLRRMNRDQLELDKIKERKLRFAGHTVRRPPGTLLVDILDTTIEGNRPRGRPRRLWMDDISEWLCIPTYTDFKVLAADRDNYRAAV